MVVSSKSWLIEAIKFMVNHPRLMILLPITLIFIIGYDVIYEFTVYPLNCMISDYYYNPIDHDWGFLNDMKHLVTSDLSNYTLTGIVLHNDDDVLNYHGLNEVSRLLSNETIILTPFTTWNVDYNKPFTKDGLLSNINYHSNYLLNSFYLNNVTLWNHLIVKSNELYIYILHTSSIDHLLTNLHNPIVESCSDNFIMQEFINYYLLIHGFKSDWLQKLVQGITIFCLMYFILHLYLSISNLHKLKSNVGVLCGWIIEVLLSATASVKIVEIFSERNYWKQVFEPSTFYTKSVFILTIALISSRNIVRIINDFAYKNQFLIEDYDIANFSTKKHLKHSSSTLSNLYRFYLGLNNNPETKYDKLDVVKSIFNKIGINYSIYIPNSTKILSIDILCMVLLEKLGRLIIAFNFNGNFEHYFDTKIKNFFRAIFIALIIDHFLQLTFLICILIIDNHRVNVTKILNNSNTVVDNDLSLDEINSISYWLLKSKPSRDSIRYKLGTSLTCVVHPTSFISWVILLPTIQFINILTVFMNWSIFMPYNLTNKSRIIKPMDIKSSQYDLFYYLEFIASLVLILSISFILFNLSNFKINKVEKDDVVELTHKKFFKTIDLKSHDLDVIKLKSNNTSFLISIGLDHKLLIWSPLKLSSPPNLSSSIIDTKNNVSTELWPINHMNISKGGEYILLISYKLGLIRCFERLSQSFKWTLDIKPYKLGNNNKIIESFFREKTLPGFLKMKMLKQRQRRGSETSMNGNYPRPLNSIGENNENLKKLEFLIITESGDILTYSCNEGKFRTTNVLENLYNLDFDIDVDATESEEHEIREKPQLKLISAKKLITPRVNDRIICQVNNRDLIVAVVVNNKWNFIPLAITEDLYNQESPIASSISSPSSLSRSSSLNYNFEGPSKLSKKPTSSFVNATLSKFEINKPMIVALEFLGMIMRVNNMIAELIDIQSGIVMNKVNIGRFKPSSFRVSHLEPTHCRFCGCASIQSLSIIYEDYDTKTVIIHTLKIQSNRSKTNICLRVERDPREIRCLGFSNVIEDQYWFDNINAWEVTDINIIIGIRRDLPSLQITSHDDMVGLEYNSSKLKSLKSRKKVKSSKNNGPSQNGETLNWEGFIITLNDGDIKSYEIPGINSNKSLITSNITCIEKFGYKSVAVSFGNIIKILYLGNDKLIEENLYFNDLNNPINNELMFLSKRRKK